MESRPETEALRHRKLMTTTEYQPPVLFDRAIGIEQDPFGDVRRYRTRPASLGDLLDAAVERWPEREHLVHGDRRLTFAAHAAAVARATSYLLTARVGPGDRVVLFASVDPDWIAALWACWRIGAIAVPLNWSWTAAQVADALEDCRPAVVVTDRAHADRIRGVRTLDLGHLIADDASPKNRSVTKPDEDSPALIIYTAGTTGRSKGALFAHRCLLAGLHNILVTSGRLPHELDADASAPVGLLSYPVFHIAGIANVNVSTAIGGKLVFGSARFDAAETARLIEREGVIAWGAVPTMVERTARAVLNDGVNVTSLRAITLGGAPMPTGLSDLLASAFPLVRRSVANAYGMTESGGTVTLASGERVAQDPSCVGRPMPVVQLRIDADESGIGEVCVRTPSAMVGYWGNLDSPFDADGYLRTGDVGYLDGDGYLHIVDRVKDIIIRGGENISPTSIEIVLRDHPAVREVVVFGRADPDLGERIVAVVVSESAAVPSLVEHCLTRLPRFQVPDEWWIRPQPLARGTLDKVLRGTLREEYIASGRGAI
jgi:long-chain acyl-CoA synthetase